MMKSFFKKLAFVMALAMVVSMVTPAGAVFAADAQGIALQTATSDAEILESYNIAVGGEPTDFKFYGCTNWKTRGLVWTSSNEAVATVDQTGKVLGITDGVATINLKSADGTYDVSLKVVVGKGDMTYVYKQVSHNTVSFIFKQDVNYTLDDVTLTRVLDGGFEVNWPIDSLSCEKNVVAVVPYGSFADGDQYIIRIGADDEGTPFTTTIGEVDEIKVFYESMDTEGVAYAKLNEDDENIDVKLSVKLYSNGVDVTKVSDVSAVEFDLVTESDDFDLNEDILVFEKSGVVAEVIASYEVDSDKEPVTGKVYVPSVPAPEYKLNVYKWTIAKSGASIDWADKDDIIHELPAFDDEKANYHVVLLMTDSYGNYVVYPNEFAAKSELGDKDILALEDLQNEEKDSFVTAAEDYSIRYTSNNLNKLFVGSVKGDLTTLGKASAYVIASLYDKNEDGDTVLVKSLTAVPVEITEERKPSTITIDKDSFKVLVDLNDFKGIESGSLKTERKFTVVDQYGDPIVGAQIVIKADYDKLNGNADKPADAKTNSDGQLKVTFYGSDFVYQKEVKGESVDTIADSVKFTANVKGYDKVKTTFTVKAVKPATNKDGSLKVEKIELEADDVDVKISKASDGTIKKSSLRLRQYSNGMQVACEEDAVLLTKGNDFLKGDNKDGAFSIKSNATVNGNALKEGDCFAVVYGPDGKALSASTGSSLGIYQENATKGGRYQVIAATAVKTDTKIATDTSMMTYLEEGTYTFKFYTVEKVYTDNGVATEKLAKLDEQTKTFTVKNGSKAVSLKKQDYVNLPEKDVAAYDVEDVIWNAFSFKFGSDDLVEPDDESEIFILDRSTKYNEDSDNLFIYNVTFAVPLNNGTDKVWYEYKVTLNKAVTVGSEFTYVEDEAYAKSVRPE